LSWRLACRARSPTMSYKICDKKDCPACDAARYIKTLLKAGCPPEDVVPFFVSVAADVLSDVVNISLEKVKSSDEVVH